MLISDLKENENAGNTGDKYIGAAPRSNIIAVKLRRARRYYINRYLLAEDNPNKYHGVSSFDLNKGVEVKNLFENFSCSFKSEFDEKLLNKDYPLLN